MKQDELHILSDAELHAMYHRYYCRHLGAIHCLDTRATLEKLDAEIIKRNPGFYEESK